MKPKKPYGEKFWERLDRYPPILCRLLARHPRGKAFSSVEIADRSGLSVMQVIAISNQTDWSGVDLPTARRFMLGCSTDLSNRSHCIRMHMYLRLQAKDPSKRFMFLRKSGEWDSYYLPLLRRFYEHVVKMGYKDGDR